MTDKLERLIHQQCIPASIFLCSLLAAVIKPTNMQIEHQSPSYQNYLASALQPASQRSTEHYTMSSSAQSAFEYSNISIFSITLPLN